MPCPIERLANVRLDGTILASGALLPVTYGRVDGVCTSDGVPELVVNCAVDDDGRGEGDEGEKKGGGLEDRRHCSELDGEH